MDTFLAILGCIASGAAVALVTGLIIGEGKAVRLPGGSLVAGLSTGFALLSGSAGIVAGAMLGILGWMIYVLVILAIRNWSRI